MADDSFVPGTKPPDGVGGSIAAACGGCQAACGDPPTQPGDTELTRCRARLEVVEWELAIAGLRELALWAAVVGLTVWLLYGWYGR